MHPQITKQTPATLVASQSAASQSAVFDRVQEIVCPEESSKRFILFSDLSREVGDLILNNVQLFKKTVNFLVQVKNEALSGSGRIVSPPSLKRKGQVTSAEIENKARKRSKGKCSSCGSTEHRKNKCPVNNTN